MPNQIYHSSPTPPIIYHQGKAYIGGMVHEKEGQTYDFVCPIPVLVSTAPSVELGTIESYEMEVYDE